MHWAFPGSPVFKTSPSIAGDEDLIPSQGADILHASWPKKQTNKQTNKKKKHKTEAIL